jgi:hypothetical protein
VVALFKNKLQVIASKVMPAQAVAAAHRKMAEPGSAKEEKDSKARREREERAHARDDVNDPGPLG